MATQSTLIQFLQNYQRSNIYFTIAGISGALGIALGAYGNHAHTLNLPENEKFKKSFSSANFYHLLHNAVLLTLPLMKRPNLVAFLLLSGQLLFCGSSTLWHLSAGEIHRQNCWWCEPDYGQKSRDYSNTRSST